MRPKSWLDHLEGFNYGTRHLSPVTETQSYRPAWVWLNLPEGRRVAIFGFRVVIYTWDRFPAEFALEWNGRGSRCLIPRSDLNRVVKQTQEGSI